MRSFNKDKPPPRYHSTRSAEDMKKEMKSLLEKKDTLHANKTPEQIKNIQDRHWELSLIRDKVYGVVVTPEMQRLRDILRGKK